MHQCREEKRDILCIWCSSVGDIFVIVPKRRSDGWKKETNRKKKQQNYLLQLKITSYSSLTFQSGKWQLKLPRNESGTNWQAAFVSLFSNERRMHKLRKLMRRFNILVTKVTNRMSSGKKVLHVWRLFLLFHLRLQHRQLVVFTSLIKSRTECSERWIEIANTFKLFSSSISRLELFSFSLSSTVVCACRLWCVVELVYPSLNKRNDIKNTDFNGNNGNWMYH